MLEIRFGHQENRNTRTFSQRFILTEESVGNGGDGGGGSQRIIGRAAG